MVALWRGSEVIDHAARQIDRANQTRRGDLHARTGQLGLQVDGLDLLLHRVAQTALTGRLGGNRRRAGRGFGLGLVGVGVEVAKGGIPAEQQDTHQQHRQQQIALILRGLFTHDGAFEPLSDPC
jgi:hypothetical protein